MSLTLKINEDIKTAMKARDSIRLYTLRLLKDSINRTEKEKKTSLDDMGTIALVRREIKKRQDTLDALSWVETPSRALGMIEIEEKLILESYLPTQMPLDELKSLVLTVIGEMGATTKKDMGKVIKAVTARLNGASDGKTISAVVQTLLP